MTFDRFSKWSKWQLRLAIFFSYFFQFFTTKVFDFILSFLTIVGIPVLFAGNLPFVWAMALIFHTIYVVFFMDYFRVKFGTDQSFIEWKEEITAMKWWLKTKQ